MSKENLKFSARWLTEYISKYKAWLIVGVITSILNAVCDIYGVYLITVLIDSALIGEKKTIMNIIIVFITLLIVGTISKYLIKYSSGKLGANVSMNIKNDILEIIQKSKISDIEKISLGNILSKITNNIAAVDNFLVNRLTDYIYIPLIVITSLSYLIIINWKLMLFSFFITPLTIYLSKVISKPIGELAEQYFDELGKANSVAQDSLNSIETVKSFNLQSILYSKYKNIMDKALKLGLKMSKQEAKMMPSVILTYEFPYVICAVVGGYFSLKGELQIAELIAFIQLLKLLVPSCTQLPTLISEARKIDGVIKGLRELEEMSFENETGIEVKNENTDILLEFENVKFQYEESNPILKGISFQLLRGKKIAIVGESGCGKSTIIDLICKFKEIDSGKISIYGYSINELSDKLIWNNISVVLQDNFLFQETIKENINYGNMDASFSEIIESSKLAQAHGFISEFSEGYDYMIAERGSNLSGGQKQRIAIARAILKDAPILLLDEATAALDIESEMLVQEAINNLAVDKTVLIIAHRLSTIEKCDTILVLKDGTIVEYGKHEELLSINGCYKQLYDRYIKENNIEKEKAQ